MYYKNTSVDVYSRWYRAYIAHARAQNPQFKKIWQSVMDHLEKDF